MNSYRPITAYAGAAILMTIILTLMLQFVPVTMAAAEQGRQSDPNALFYKGNAHYEAGEYSRAIEIYETVLAQGMESGNLYYNLGNSYFKEGNLGKAILNYERAKRLMPRDSDLRSNFEFALDRISKPAPEEPARWYSTLFSLFHSLTVNEMSILLSALYATIVVTVITRMFFPGAGKGSVYAISVLLTISILLSASLYSKISSLENESVVTAQRSDARFEPLDQGTTHFTLHEGMKIRLLHTKGDWSKVKRPDGKVGWIKSRDLDAI